jgi:hypothetical protein
MKRFRILIILATIASLGVATPVLAAAPTNDTAAGATLVTSGYSASVDTSDATTDADDAQANLSCGAPATDASVWYTIVGTDAGVVVDVSTSTYSAGLLVATGSPGSLSTLTCGPGAVGFFGASGTTYYVLAFDDQTDGAGNGGTLEITFADAPPPPTVSVTLAPTGYVNAKTGVARLSGTYACTGADFIEVYGDARQRVGRFVVRGFMDFFADGTCDGADHPWAADVYPENGLFAGGKAMAVTFAFSCGPFECAEGYAEQTVQLSGRKK